MRGDHQWHATRLGLLAALLILFLIRFRLVHAGLDFLWNGFMLVYLVFTAWSAMRLVLFAGLVDWNRAVPSCRAGCDPGGQRHLGPPEVRTISMADVISDFTWGALARLLPGTA
jgi:hypothetical protein